MAELLLELIWGLTFTDRRAGISRRHSMERMELMKLTPDKKDDFSNGGARPKIPKVQKSQSVASETFSLRKEEVTRLLQWFMSS